MRRSPWRHNITFYSAIAPISGTAQPAQDLNPFQGWLNLIVNTAMCEHAVVGFAVRPTFPFAESPLNQRHPDRRQLPG